LTPGPLSLFLTSSPYLSHSERLHLYFQPR
jgi:hypothetical protein